MTDFNPVQNANANYVYRRRQQLGVPPTAGSPPAPTAPGYGYSAQQAALAAQQRYNEAAVMGSPYPPMPPSLPPPHYPPSSPGVTQPAVPTPQHVHYIPVYPESLGSGPGSGRHKTKKKKKKKKKKHKKHKSETPPPTHQPPDLGSGEDDDDDDPNNNSSSSEAAEDGIDEATYNEIQRMNMRPPGARDDEFPSEKFRRKVKKVIEVPYTRTVKVPVMVTEEVTKMERRAVPTKKLITEPSWKVVQEPYQKIIPKEKTRMKEVWVKKLVPETYTVNEVRHCVREVKKPTTVVREVDDVEEVDVPVQSTVEVPSYRVDRIRDTKIVEVEGYQEFDLVPREGAFHLEKARPSTCRNPECPVPGRHRHHVLDRVVGREAYRADGDHMAWLPTDYDTYDPNSRRQQEAPPRGSDGYTQQGGGGGRDRPPRRRSHSSGAGSRGGAPMYHASPDGPYGDHMRYYPEGQVNPSSPRSPRTGNHSHHTSPPPLPTGNTGSYRSRSPAQSGASPRQPYSYWS